jgi:transcriptional accessory protein Tex/SPT6
MSDQEVATAEPEIKAQEAEATSATSEATPASAETEGVTSTPSSPSTEEAAIETSAGESSQNEAGSFSIYTLQPGQKLTGKVKNIATFGAFVDIGLPQDGLVHISELAKKKVEKVSDVVSVGQEIEVWVKKVDQQRGRISLTMIKPLSLRLKDIAEEAELEGVVTRLESYGVFVDIGSVRDGLVHISQITHEYIKHPQDALAVGDTVKVKVLKVNRKKRQIDLSIKALLPPPQVQEPVREEPKREESRREVKVEAKPQVVEEVATAQETEEEPATTAMAMAYAAMQSRNQAAKTDKSGGSDEKNKQRKELDDIISRTLASTK